VRRLTNRKKRLLSLSLLLLLATKTSDAALAKPLRDWREGAFAVVGCTGINATAASGRRQ